MKNELNIIPAPTKLDRSRWLGYSAGLFPGVAIPDSSREIATFFLAMGRKVTFDLPAQTWRETSPRREASGAITDQGATYLASWLGKQILA